MASEGFDIDQITQDDIEEHARPLALYDLADLGRVLTQHALLPPGGEAKATGSKDFSYQQPGMEKPVRVTTDPAFFEQHSDSVELWSPGAPIFPPMADLGTEVDVTEENFRRIIPRSTHS